MSGGTLGDTGFGNASFYSGKIVFDEFLEEIASATQLGMAECVCRCVGGNVIAVGVDQAFADDDHAVLLALENTTDVFETLGLVERDFRKINQMRSVMRMIAAFGERSARGDPAGTAAHDFDDRYEIALA